MSIDFNEEIISGKSIGNINIGDKKDKWLSCAYENNLHVEENVFSEYFTEYKINNVISFVCTNNEGVIVNISCRNGYKGFYKGTFYPEMSVKDIIKFSDFTLLLHGFLLIDPDKNIGFNIPEEFEEFDFVEQLPENLILSDLYIMKEDWWRS